MVPSGSIWIAGLVPILLIAILWMALLGWRRSRIRSSADSPGAEELPHTEAREDTEETGEDSKADEADKEMAFADATGEDAEAEPEEQNWRIERDPQTWRELGWSLQEAGREEDAARAFRCALDALEEGQADSAWELHQELGALYIQRQQLREAQQHAVAACACAEMAFGSPSAQQAEALNALGALLEQMGNWSQARAQYRAALDIEQAVYGEASERVGAAYSAIARMSERLMDRSDALRNYLRAYHIIAEKNGYSGPDTENAKEDVERAYRAEDRAPELFEEWLEKWQPEE